MLSQSKNTKFDVIEKVDPFQQITLDIIFRSLKITDLNVARGVSKTWNAQVISEKKERIGKINFHTVLPLMLVRELLSDKKLVGLAMEKISFLLEKYTEIEQHNKHPNTYKQALIKSVPDQGQNQLANYVKEILRLLKEKSKESEAFLKDNSYITFLEQQKRMLAKYEKKPEGIESSFLMKYINEQQKILGYYKSVLKSNEKLLNDEHTKKILEKNCRLAKRLESEIESFFNGFIWAGDFLKNLKILKDFILQGKANKKINTFLIKTESKFFFEFSKEKEGESSDLVKFHLALAFIRPKLALLMVKSLQNTLKYPEFFEQSYFDQIQKFAQDFYVQTENIKSYEQTAFSKYWLRITANYVFSGMSYPLTLLSLLLVSADILLQLKLNNNNSYNNLIIDPIAFLVVICVPIALYTHAMHLIQLYTVNGRIAGNFQFPDSIKNDPAIPVPDALIENFNLQRTHLQTFLASYKESDDSLSIKDRLISTLPFCCISNSSKLPNEKTHLLEKIVIV